MNKLKFLVAVFAALVMGTLITSCNKEESVVQKASNESSLEVTNDIMKKYSLDEMIEITKGFGSEMATFEDVNQYSNFLITFSSLTEEQKLLVLKEVNYETIDIYLETLLTELDKLNSTEGVTKEDVYAFVKQNDKYLKIVMHENREEEIIIQNVSKYYGLPFFNRDQIVKIGNEFHKYLNTYSIKSKDVSELKLVETEGDILNSGLTYKKVVESQFESSEVFNDGARWGDENNEYQWRETYDQPWCRNDRRIRLSLDFRSNINTFNDPIFGVTEQHAVERVAILDALKKGVPCIWYRYSSNITWNNFDFRYRQACDGTITSHIWTLANSTQNASRISRSNPIAFYAIPLIFCDFEWTSKRTDATHGGMNGIWLNVNE